MEEDHAAGVELLTLPELLESPALRGVRTFVLSVVSRSNDIGPLPRSAPFLRFNNPVMGAERLRLYLSDHHHLLRRAQLDPDFTLEAFATCLQVTPASPNLLMVLRNWFHSPTSPRASAAARAALIGIMAQSAAQRACSALPAPSRSPSPPLHGNGSTAQGKTSASAPNGSASAAQGTSARIYLECSYEAGMEMMHLGARWDQWENRWYIPEGVEPALFLPLVRFARHPVPALTPPPPAEAEQRHLRFFGSPRLYLNCPFSQKEQCKALGGKWDPRRKQWYVPEGQSLRSFRRWFPRPEPQKPTACASAAHSAKAEPTVGTCASASAAGGRPKEASAEQREQAEASEPSVRGQPVVTAELLWNSFAEARRIMAGRTEDQSVAFLSDLAAAAEVAVQKDEALEPSVRPTELEVSFASMAVTAEEQLDEQAAVAGEQNGSSRLQCLQDGRDLAAAAMKAMDERAQRPADSAQEPHQPEDASVALQGSEKVEAELAHTASQREEAPGQPLPPEPSPAPPPDPPLQSPPQNAPELGPIDPQLDVPDTCIVDALRLQLDRALQRLAQSQRTVADLRRTVDGLNEENAQLLIDLRASCEMERASRQEIRDLSQRLRARRREFGDLLLLQVQDQARAESVVHDRSTSPPPHPSQ